MIYLVKDLSPIKLLKNLKLTIARGNRAAVLDAHGVRRRPIIQLGQVVADRLVDRLRHVAGADLARADGPDGLVGDDDARLVLEGLEDGHLCRNQPVCTLSSRRRVDGVDFHTGAHDVLELVRALGEDRVDALLADGQRLADAEDAGQALVQNVLEFRGHEFVRLLRRRQAELAAPLAAHALSSTW